MRALPALSLVLLAGCATTGGSIGPVALEQTQRVGRVYITPVNVISDKRCPQEQRCDLPGRVTVRATVDGGWGGWGWGGWGPLDGDTERNFILGVPTQVGRRTIVLDSVTPEPSAGTLVSSAPYRFNFVEIPR